MPHEGFADPVTSDRTGFHLNMTVSKLTGCITGAIKANDVTSTPPVAKTADGATVTKASRPLIESRTRVGAQ